MHVKEQAWQWVWEATSILPSDSEMQICEDSSETKGKCYFVHSDSKVTPRSVK